MKGLIKVTPNKSKRPEKIPKDEIYKLSCEGLSQVSIAKQLGCSRGYVSKVLNNYSTTKKENRMEQGIITYTLSKEEIEKRYGAPGQYKQVKKQYA